MFVWLAQQTAVAGPSLYWRRLVFSVRYEFMYSLDEPPQVSEALPCPRRSVAGLSPLRSGFRAKPIRVTFVVHKVPLAQVSLPVLRVSPVSTIPPLPHTHSFTYHSRYIMFPSQYFSFPLSVSFHQFVYHTLTLYDLSNWQRRSSRWIALSYWRWRK